MNMNCLDWQDVESAAKELAGNHYEFDCFAWSNRPEDGDNWALVYTHHRDSGLLDQSNAAQIATALESFMDGGEPDVVSERHRHFAVGWVDGFAIRVYREDGTITEAFRVYCELQARMEEYPILNEEDYSQREYDAAIDAIKWNGERFVKEETTENWKGEVFSWLWNNRERELDNVDDTGAYPSEEAIKEALAELGFLEEEE